MGESALIYDELNKRWKSTCKLLLGEEVGELKDYEEWLSSKRQQIEFRKALNGKRVSFAFPHYSKNTRIIPFDEVDFNKKFEPLSINEIKDIDSIIGAVSERIAYTGNIVLGNSEYIEDSTDVVDCFYVKSSAQVWASKYIAYCKELEFSENLFGVTNVGNCKFCIKSYSGDFMTRCFQTEQTYDSSDCHYCFGMCGCKNCMFSFNLQNAAHRIGNVQLDPQKYNELKKKLLSEMAEMLRRDRTLPSLFELASLRSPDASALEGIKRTQNVKIESTGDDISQVESEFSQTAKILLGKELGPIKKYEKWLRRFSTLPVKKCRSAFDGRGLLISDYCNNFSYPENRLMKRAHAMAVGSSCHADKGAVGNADLKSIPNLISKIAYFTAEYDAGKLRNMVESEVSIDSINCLGSTINVNVKNCAYAYYSAQSNSIFGSNSIRKSSYAMKCYLSTNLTRCFEVDSSRTCTDLYFSHDCENVHDSMFCFNTKNKRNAIGNAELPKEKYAGIKEKIKSELADELEKTGGLSISIFSLGK